VVESAGEEWTVPCDMIGQTVAGYLDAGDFTASSRTTTAACSAGWPGRPGPDMPVAELDAGELAAQATAAGGNAEAPRSEGKGR
jgi:hypothetical protein